MILIGVYYDLEQLQPPATSLHAWREGWKYKPLIKCMLHMFKELQVVCCCLKTDDYLGQATINGHLSPQCPRDVFYKFHSFVGCLDPQIEVKGSKKTLLVLPGPDKCGMDYEC